MDQAIVGQVWTHAEGRTDADGGWDSKVKVYVSGLHVILTHRQLQEFANRSGYNPTNCHVTRE